MAGRVLLCAKRLDNFQGGFLRVRSSIPSLNLTYSTFWNGFAHYSVYGKGEGTVTPPLQYDDFSKEY